MTIFQLSEVNAVKETEKIELRSGGVNHIQDDIVVSTMDQITPGLLPMPRIVMRAMSPRQRREVA